MKKMNLSVAFLVLVSMLHAQYKVTKIAGRIKTGAGKYVKPGNEVNDNDLLIFSSANDKLWVIIPGSGEKIISPSPQAQVTGKGVSQLLKEANMSGTKEVSLRGGIDVLEKIPLALKTVNATTDKIIIEPENKFLFDKTAYPQQDSNFFFLQVSVPSQLPISRRLTAVDDTLLINYTHFLTESDNPRNTYLLGYYDKGNVTTVSKINPYFDLTNEMEDIIAGTVNTYKKENMPKEALMTKTYNIVYSTSGKPNGLLFSSLFNKYWLGNISDTQKINTVGTGNNFDETDFMSTPVLSNLVSTSRDEMPANFSLRQYAPPVGYQGNFATCVAWACGYAMRTIAFAVRNHYTIQENRDKIASNTFSPEFVYNNIQSSGDCNSGTTFRRCLEFIKNNGDVLAKGNDFVCGRAYMSNDVEKAKTYRLKDYQRVNDWQNKSGETETINRVKALLYNRHPVGFSLDVYESFKAVTASGIWNPEDLEYQMADSARKNPLLHKNGHAMCVIGYNDAIADGAFEIMNSWGTDHGNNGYYWITYQDFYRFANEMYTISDYEDTYIQSGDTTVAVKSKDTLKPAPLVIKPAEITAVVILADNRPGNIHKDSLKPGPAIVKPLENTTVVIPADDKPRLKGNMEFIRLKQISKAHESIGVTKLVTAASSDALRANADTSNYLPAYYNLARPLYTYNKYQIKFNLAQPAYVYIIGVGAANSYYRLFPDPKKPHESPLINFSNATLALPGDSTFYTLDTNSGKEKMCFLFSKSPLGIDTLDNEIGANSRDIYTYLNKTFANRLVNTHGTPVNNNNNNKLYFDTEVTDDKILALFVQIDHL